jgi:putative CocE/NonD family hydrolase
MIGGSYVGWVQWWAASQRPPHLVTIIPNVSPPDPFYNIPYEYGVLFLKAALWWAEVLDKEATADLSGAKMMNLAETKYHKLLRALPVIDLDRAVQGKANPYWRKWIEHPVNDAYWEQANFQDLLKDVTIPVYHQSGWFDGDGIGTKLNYLAMARHHHPHQKLVLGPWGHTDEAERRHRDRDFGPNAILDLQRSYLRWFDYWLKGIDNGITREPLVSVFVMGSDQWLHGDTYPLPGTRFEKWYLSSGGSANTSKGNGRLSAEPPSAQAAPDAYTYDPGDPTPDPEDYEEPEDPADKSGPKVKSSEEKKKAAEAHHGQVIEHRPDILVYTTEPLDKPLTFAGPLSAVLYAASSARDTDWFVRLMEVDAKGKIFQLAEGKIRARYRRTTKEAELLQPDKVYEYTIDLWQTGITIPKGNRLRVEVASASFPSFSRNLNTGGHNETETHYIKAAQKIYHSKQYPSHVLLPVVEVKGKEAPKKE